VQLKNAQAAPKMHILNDLRTIVEICRSKDMQYSLLHINYFKSAAWCLIAINIEKEKE
jgi:hypothetical protein